MHSREIAASMRRPCVSRVWLGLLAMGAMVLASCTANHELGRRGSQSSQERKRLGMIRPSADGTHFVHVDSGERFTVWGVNYDHDPDGRLLEDYWHAEWATVVEDFEEMAALGANAVRIHLQLGKFMKSPEQPNTAELEQLGRLLELAKRTGLYLNLTGLACYHKQDVPPWYDAMSEADRWAVQARFWEAVAKTCAGHPAMFCYDLMNEPILPGDDKKETDWLAGEFGGKYFVQRITLDLAGRSRHEVARAWIDTLVSAIRKHDLHTMITVGVIPWAHVWPQAKPLFYAPEVGVNLDFACVHFYPKSGQVEKALAALAVYRVGKPLVVEEMFALECGIEELDAFIEGSRDWVAGYFGFYWGRTIEEYAALTGEQRTIGAAITQRWLEYFRDKAAQWLREK